MGTTVVTDLYLIAHKVRSEAAFDIACQIQCPECQGGSIIHSVNNYTNGTDTVISCQECDGEGYWWIIPTSGHRAYPYWSKPLSDAKFNCDSTCLTYEGFAWEDVTDVGQMPPDLPDHYTTRAAGPTPKRNLLAELGLSKPVGHPAIVGKLNRRI